MSPWRKLELHSAIPRFRVIVIGSWRQALHERIQNRLLNTSLFRSEIERNRISQQVLSFGDLVTRHTCSRTSRDQRASLPSDDGESSAVSSLTDFATSFNHRRSNWETTHKYIGRESERKGIIFLQATSACEVQGGHVYPGEVKATTRFEVYFATGS